MEEYDELLPTPDEDGKLELSYRAWSEVDEIVWTMGATSYAPLVLCIVGEELVCLSLCYNRLTSIAQEVLARLET